MKDKNISEIIEKPMDNFEIKEYLPNAKILTNKDIQNYKNIEQIFNMKNFADYVILLYLNSDKSGHWTALLKMGDNTPDKTFIEFFDSYGGTPQDVYNYVSQETREKLGTNNDIITKLLNECPYNVLCNRKKFQSNREDVSTCGRHCCYRSLMLMNDGLDLPDYIKYMDYLKNKTGYNFDEIVSQKINL